MVNTKQKSFDTTCIIVTETQFQPFLAKKLYTPIN